MDLEKPKPDFKVQVRDFQSWFQREYLRRRKSNEAYSIRAFSNYLKMASGTVSHLMSGKRRPSKKFVEKLFGQLDATLKWDPLESTCRHASLSIL